MRDDPKKIASQLRDQYGLEGAQAVALQEVTKASAAKDYYSLSIWREVRHILARDASTKAPRE
jgi:hypothetical protein